MLYKYFCGLEEIVLLRKSSTTCTNQLSASGNARHRSPANKTYNTRQNSQNRKNPRSCFRTTLLVEIGFYTERGIFLEKKKESSICFLVDCSQSFRYTHCNTILNKKPTFVSTQPPSSHKTKQEVGIQDFPHSF